MYTICEISYFLKHLKNYESHLVLNIFDFLFASTVINNCQYGLELIFLCCFGISLKKHQLHKLKNSVFEYVNNHDKMNPKISIYNLEYYMEGCIKHYLKNYNKYYANIYENTIKYNNWVIKSYGNFIKIGVLTNNLEDKNNYINTRLYENYEYQKKLDEKEKIVKTQILSIIFNLN